MHKEEGRYQRSLYCIVLYCIVLYCIVLYCIVLKKHCIALYCVVLYCIVLYCIVLYFILFLGALSAHLQRTRDLARNNLWEELYMERLPFSLVVLNFLGFHSSSVVMSVSSTRNLSLNKPMLGKFSDA